MAAAEPSRFDRLAPFVAIPLLALVAWMQVRFAIMGDKGWLLYAADEWVAGKKLYIDIVEVNPPLILWIYAIPAWIAAHTPYLLDYQALGLLGLVCICCVIWLSMRIIRRHPAFAEDTNRRMEFLLLLVFVFVYCISPVYFFDREHIMVAFALPYMLRFMPSLAHERYPLWLKLLIGLMGGIGFSIKPHAVLIFAALQVIYFIRERSPAILISTENIIIYLFGAGYLAAIVVFTPEYLHFILPMVYAVYYGYNIRGTMHYYLPLIFLSACIPLLDFRPRYDTPWRRDIYYFIFIPVLYFIYALINNGWGYTYEPLFCMLMFMTAWLLWEYVWLKKQHIARGLPFNQFEVGIRGSTYCLAVNGIISLFTLHMLLSAESCGGYFGCKANEPFTTAIKERNIKSFGVMAGEFTRWPLISRESGARWDTRFNNLWMVPGLLKAPPEKAASNQWILDYVGAGLADDMLHRKPDAIFVDSGDEFFTYGKPVDILAMFTKIPAFKKAWRHYRPDGTIDHCHSRFPDSPQTVGCRYDIYRWKDSVK